MSTKKTEPRKIFRDLPVSSEAENAQIDKFQKAARELEADESEEAFDATLKKIAKSPPPKGDKKEDKKPAK